MAPFKIAFKHSVNKNLTGIPRHDVERILKAIGGLAADPNPNNAVRLTGRDAFRLRVGRYCAIYAIDNEEVVILIIKVGHRGGVCR